MSQSRRRNRAATRVALLDSARRRFAEHGYDGVGVREIASDAGVDAALVFRYFGSKRALFAEAVHVENPEDAGRDPRQGVVALADALLNEVVFADGAESGAEHPLLTMLRSAGRPEVRAEVREQVCEKYLAAMASRLDGADARLHSELLGALLVGIGLMRSVIETPELAAASFEEARGAVADMVLALQRRTGS